MSEKCYNLKDGINAHFIKNEKYKTDFSCIIITTPLTRENVTKNALIPFMLRRGTKKFPNQYLINKKLEDMYGAEFNCGIDKIGDNVVLKFCIESINNEYALEENEDILKENIDCLFDIVFDPVTTNGKLNKGFLEVEKKNLKDIIESKIDNKDSYALISCISKMYGEKGFGLYKYGYIEDVDDITIDDITEYYRWLIKNAKIDIFISGNFNENDMQNYIENNSNIKKLNAREENYILDSTESKQIVENVKEIKEEMDVTQGKLVIGLDINSNINNFKAVAKVYNSILGDGANSMMFQNVREKASLAYSAKSIYFSHKKNIFIRCGIQIENYEKALELIKVQLENIRKGEFSIEDLENAKKYLVSEIQNIEEEQDTEIVYYIGQEISKTNTSISEYIDNINKVTKEQVEMLANSVAINTIYFLTGKSKE